MAEFKGTPGQWRWVKGYAEAYVLRSDSQSDYEYVIDDGSAAGEYSPTIDVNGADARLIAAAPDLLAALQDGDGAQFYEWLADRLVNVYGENDNVDFVRALRRKAEKQKAAVERALHGDDADE